MGTALTERAAARAEPADEAALPLLRRRRRRPGRDAARDGARRARRASTCRSCRCRRARIPPTTRRRSSAASRRPSATRCTACGSLHERARDKNAAFAAIRRSSTRSRTRPSIRTRGASRRSPRPAAGDAGGVRAGPRQLERGGVDLAAPARRRVAARARRARRRRRAPEARAYLEELGPEHFDDELHRRARAHLLGQESRTAT